jgi:glycosyltransferase involved in cell wall biosynthesis
MSARPEPLTQLLFVIPSLQSGGAERVMITLLRHLDRSRFRIALAVLDLRDAVFRDQVPEDIELIDLNAQRVRHALPKLIRMIWQRKPDVVFTTLGHLNLAIASLRWMFPRDVRLIVREVTIVSHLPGLYAIPRWWFWLYRFYRGLDAVVCQSQAMRDDLVQELGVPAEKTVVIPNPVDLEHIRYLAAEGAMPEGALTEGKVLRLVAAGSLTNVKGFDILIQALAACSGFPWHLTVLGEGPQRPQLEAQIAALGLCERIELVGFVKNPYAHFAAADALVLSSRFEGFPNVVLEALACGTPVVATPSPGGVREILQDIRECLLAADCTPGALAAALQSFQRGRRVPATAVARYAIGPIVRRYEQCIVGAQVQ